MKKIELKVNHIVPRADGQYVREYLKTLGVKEKDLDSFLYAPRETDEDNPMLLDGMLEAINVAHDILIKPGARLGVIVDSDTDGFTSAAVLISYIRERFPQVAINYYFHPGKEHGIVPEYFNGLEDLIIIPDAGSNDYEQQRKVVEKSGNHTRIIILDHHEVINYQQVSNVILVNNQRSPSFTNPNLSGVGIVYMFIKAMDEMFFDTLPPIYRRYLDLVAVGLIADAMNMLNLGNNYLVYYGLRNINNPFLKELAIKQSRGIKDPQHLTKVDVMFYIAPVINGVIRSGSKEDKETVFKAMVEPHNVEMFDSEWRGKERHETLYEYAVRLATNAKSRQDSAKHKSFEWLKDKIITEGLDKDNLIIVTLDQDESSKVSANITGLIAMELVKEFNKPCCVLRKTIYEGKEMYGGSARNGIFYGLPDLLEFIYNSGFAYYVGGHANAFGIFLLPEQVQQLRDYANEKLNATTFEDTTYTVDYIFNNENDIDVDMLKDFAESDYLWGNSIPRPSFAFNFDQYLNEIQYMGTDKTSIKIHKHNVDFVAFKDAALKEAIGNYAKQHLQGHFTIIGSPSINEFRGVKSIQVIIDDYDIGEAQPKARMIENAFGGNDLLRSLI